MKITTIVKTKGKKHVRYFPINTKKLLTKNGAKKFRNECINIGKQLFVGAMHEYNKDWYDKVDFEEICK